MRRSSPPTSVEYGHVDVELGGCPVDSLSDVPPGSEVQAAVGEPGGQRLANQQASCATLLVAGGADPVAVQRHLGHRDVTTTMNVYAGLFPNRLDEIATALDGLYRAAQSAG